MEVDHNLPNALHMRMTQCLRILGNDWVGLRTKRPPTSPRLGGLTTMNLSRGFQTSFIIRTTCTFRMQAFLTRPRFAGLTTMMLSLLRQLQVSFTVRTTDTLRMEAFLTRPRFADLTTGALGMSRGSQVSFTVRTHGRPEGVSVPCEKLAHEPNSLVLHLSEGGSV